jgi:RimJ/RimL family protein N-acetyltransferase
MTTITKLQSVETPSLVLREIEQRDAPTFSNFMTQEAYQRHIAVRLASEHDVRAFVTRAVSRQSDDRRNCFHLAAEEKLSGEAIGDGFLILQHPNTVEIGWGLHPAMWGMGLGTEIGHALLGMAFERLRANSVWCKVMDGNQASARLAARIGLRHLKSHPDYPASPGRNCQVDFYAMDESDYFNLAY